MIRRVALAVVVAAAVSAVVAGRVRGYGVLADVAILAPLGAAAAVLAELIAGQPSIRPAPPARRDRRARRAVLAAGVVLFAELMFVSNHDAFFMALVAAYAALIGLRSGTARCRRALSDLDLIRAALAEVGARRSRGSHRRSPAPTSSRSWRATSRRWSPRSPARSAPAATWSPRCRTTCGRRSRRCGCSPRHSRTTSSSPTAPVTSYA